MLWIASFLAGTVPIAGLLASPARLQDQPDGIVAPRDVGPSSARLGRLGSVLRAHVEAGELAGVAPTEFDLRTTNRPLGRMFNTRNPSRFYNTIYLQPESPVSDLRSTDA